MLACNQYDFDDYLPATPLPATGSTAGCTIPGFVDASSQIGENNVKLGVEPLHLSFPKPSMRVLGLTRHNVLEDLCQMVDLQDSRCRGRDRNYVELGP